MEEIQEIPKPSIYSIPGIPYPVHMGGKRTILKAIADAWDVPEDWILSNTIVVNKIHPSPQSARGERQRITGERQRSYVNARKFYFYVMVEVKHYKWHELTELTGRKIAAMRYAIQKAKVHMALEPEYMKKAKKVLDMIEERLIIFPIEQKQVISYTKDIPISERTPAINLLEQNQEIFD